MQIIRTKILMLAIPLLLSSFGLSAQGWEQSFGGIQDDGFFDVLNTPDGGFLTVGHKQISNNPTHFNIYLVKLDAGGFVDWSKELNDSTYSYFAKSIEPTDDGGYVIGGTSRIENIPSGFIAKTDGFGNLEWDIKTQQDSVWGTKALQLSDGTFMLAGTKFAQGVNGQDRDFFQMRVSADGSNILQTHSYGGTLYDECKDIIETPQGDLIMVGYTSSQGAGHYDVMLLRTDVAGDTIWTKTLGTPDAELAYSIAATNDGNYVITGQEENLVQGSEDVFLAKINPQGEEIWWRTYVKEGLDKAWDVQYAGSGGGFVITGYTQQNQQSDRQAFLMKTYANGDEHWRRLFGGLNHEGGVAVRAVPTFGFIVAGFTSSYSQGGSDGYVIRTDMSGATHSCVVLGNVHTNENSSCKPEEFGMFPENILIEVAGATTYYGTTDENGNYAVPVKEGNYNVRLINPSPYWGLCEDSISVFLSGSFDTAVVNYSLLADTTCAFMTVDLSTLSMRRCFQNVYTVSYCNLGTIEANPGEIEVTFDPYLIIDSASVPWISNIGNTYLFDVGYLGPFDCGSFNVYYTVDCDSTVLGQTHCSETHIYPDQFCLDPDPQWDESSIELNASCDGDSILFKITNIGSGDMVDPLGFIIIEDLIVGLQGDFQLTSGEDTTIVLPASGANWRMETEQSKGHPGISKPCISVVGCGGATINSGFVIQYPLNDADPFVDADCRDNTGSYDPNDKTGFPLGFDEDHFILKNTDIEYLIRFQNTGTDTALTVVIRDTLSPYLDPTSIEMGGGSHAFRYELYGQGIMKFIFDEIMLPDSNVNEPASHGFVKFRIKQKRDLSLNTKIFNKAAIYFDYNEPIITNTTLHTVTEYSGYVGTIDHYGSESLPWVHVYPNPFFEKATFELKNVNGNDFQFQLLDVNGKLVSSSSFKGKTFQFNQENLPGGLYFYRIINEGMDVYSGKIFLR
jgi:hypothetical protein